MPAVCMMAGLCSSSWQAADWTAAPHMQVDCTAELELCWEYLIAGMAGLQGELWMHS